MRANIDVINIEINGIDSQIAVDAIQGFKHTMSHEVFSLLSNANLSSSSISNIEINPLKIKSPSPRLIRKKLAQEIVNSIKQQMMNKGENL